MKHELDVSVVICTYNRAAMLAPAIESVLNQKTEGVRFEFVVVDNNSNDDTRDVIDRYIRRGENVRYLFEGKQGVSNARNAGIANTSAPIIAYTDDDVRVGADWVVKIKQAFDKYPDIDFLGGKVLPMWESEPPAWLTREHWSPLALVDYGDSAFQIDRDRQLCLVAANLAVRRQLFDRVGVFTPEFGRIGASSCEDHEFELRAFESGAKGLYLPGLVIRAEVQKERLTKAYHRKWHSGHGKSMALIRAYDLPEAESSDTANDVDARLFGIPAYVYRDVAVNSLRMVKGILLRDESGAFECEGKIRDAVNYIREICKKRTKPRRSAVSEVAAFASSLAQKKLGRSRS